MRPSRESPLVTSVHAPTRSRRRGSARATETRSPAPHSTALPGCAHAVTDRCSHDRRRSRSRSISPCSLDEIALQNIFGISLTTCSARGRPSRHARSAASEPKQPIGSDTSLEGVVSAAAEPHAGPRGALSRCGLAPNDVTGGRTTSVRHRWSRGDSNPGPPPCKGGALPAKLRPRAVARHSAPRVGAPGLEPGTSALSGPRSDHLSYAPTAISRVTSFQHRTVPSSAQDGARDHARDLAPGVTSCKPARVAWIGQGSPAPRPPRRPWRPCQRLTSRRREHTRGSVPRRSGSPASRLDQKPDSTPRLPAVGLALPRKEVIQPQLPLRLPCYDFVPITSPALDGCLPEAG